MPTLKPAVGYLRRSTEKQEASIRDQKKAIEEYAVKNGYVIIRWYIDDGISGDATKSRLGFQRMIEEASARDFRFIICWDQDRFGRFDSLEAGFWIFPLRDAGVSLVTLNEGVIDWNSFAGRVMYSLKQEGKHQFLRDLSRNVLRGQIESAKNGSWIGQVPYGYILEAPRKGRRLVPDEVSKVKTVERIYREFVDEGRSLNDIAARLNKARIPSPKGRSWRYDSVKGILGNPVYTGLFRFNATSRCKYYSYRKGTITEGSRSGRNDEADWIIRHENHDPLVTQGRFARAQAILAKGKTGRNRYTPDDNPYLLSGLLRCSHCGEPLWGANHQNIRTYECSTKQQHGDCPGTTVRETVVLDRLVEYVESEFLPVEAQLKLMDKAERGELRPQDLPEAFAKLRRLILGRRSQQINPENVKRQIKLLKEKRDKVTRNLAFVEPDFIPGLQDEIRKLDEQRVDLERELKNRPGDQEVNETVLEVLRKLFWLCNLKPDSLKPVLREVDHITVHTAKSGKGRRSRHAFERGDIHFKSVRGVTGKKNLHLLGQSQAAYR